MYEYNKLSDSERKMILDVRASQEYPLHAAPRSKNSAVYLITAACYQHKNIFFAKENLHWLCCNFLKGLEDADFSPIAWVFLPNHHHLLLPYIHKDPAKHGWTQEPELWPWSSIHQYIKRLGKENLMKESEKYDLSNYGSGWDL